MEEVEKDVEAAEKKIMKWRQLKRKYTERANDNKEARLNLRDITDWEHVVYEEALMDAFERIEELEKLLKG
jgi:hypothetical protein